MKALLLGDFSPTQDNRDFFIRKDIPTLFTDTLPLFAGNDINFVNLECALTQKTCKINKIGPCLQAPLQTAQVLQKIGVNYCGLSNNHIFDFGAEGIKDTRIALKEAGIEVTGFGDDYMSSRKNLVIKKSGQKIVIITVCEHEYSYALEDRMGARPFCPIDTLEDIRAAKAESDRVIVLYHGGKEHCRYPSPRLLQVCRAMARNGADVVLCQHSHCIGCYENYLGSHILYGQGNSHFVKAIADETLRHSWNNSLAVHYDTASHEIAFTPLVNTQYGITLAKGKEKTQIMEEFSERNTQLSNGQWRTGWHEFCVSQQNNYLMVVENAYKETSSARANEMFAHYLDCEAHVDVWKEIFPTYNQTNEKQ